MNTLNQEMIQHIMIVIGGIIATPYLMKLAYSIARYVTVRFYPVTTIVIQVKDCDGNVKEKKIKLSNSHELAQAILNKGN